MYPISYVTGRLHVLGHRPNLQIPVPPPRPASAEQGCELGGEGGISCGCDAGRGRQLSTRAHSLTADRPHWLRARQREDRRPNEERSGEQGRARVERGQQRFSQPPTAEPAGDVRLASVPSSEIFEKRNSAQIPPKFRLYSPLVPPLAPLPTLPLAPFPAGQSPISRRMYPIRPSVLWLAG
jgi:hypothetical protein